MEEQVLQEKANTLMQQLIQGQTVRLDNLLFQNPQIKALLQQLESRKIISLNSQLSGVLVTPLKPQFLNRWNEFKTLSRFNSWLQLMDKNMEQTTTKKKTVFFKKKDVKWIISVAVIAAISFLVKWGLNKWVSDEAIKEIPQLTVFVTDEQGNVVLEHTGEVNTSLGNRPLRGIIGEDGRVNFDDLQKSYVGDTIQLGFKAEGWELAHLDTLYVFTGKPIKLQIRKDASLGIIKGAVKSRKSGEYLAGAAVRINTDTIIYTDSSGFFKVTLPPKFRVKDIHQGYRLEASKEGFQSETEHYYPTSNPLEIPLYEK
jgi:hypothetical protein